MVLVSLIALFAISFDIERETHELKAIDVGITQGYVSGCDVTVMDSCGVVNLDNFRVNDLVCYKINAEGSTLTKRKQWGYSFKVSGTEVMCNCGNYNIINVACNYKEIDEVRIRGDSDLIKV